MAAAEPAVFRDAVGLQSCDRTIWNRPPRPCLPNVRQRTDHSCARSMTAGHRRKVRPRRGDGRGERSRSAAQHRLRTRARRTCRAYRRRDAVPCDDPNRRRRRSVSRRLWGAERRFGHPLKSAGHRIGRRPKAERHRAELLTRKRCSCCEAQKPSLRYAVWRGVACRSSWPCGVQDTRSRGSARTSADAAPPAGEPGLDLWSPSPRRSAARFAGASQFTPSQALGSPQEMTYRFPGADSSPPLPRTGNDMSAAPRGRHAGTQERHVSSESHEWRLPCRASAMRVGSSDTPCARIVGAGSRRHSGERTQPTPSQRVQRIARDVHAAVHSTHQERGDLSLEDRRRDSPRSPGRCERI